MTHLSPEQLSLFDASENKAPTTFSFRSEGKATLTLTPQIPYVLKRVRRRSVGLRIGPAGLEVSAPRYVSQTEIDRIIAQKRTWIEKKLAERAAWREREGIGAMRFENGGMTPYRGSRLCLAVLGVTKTGLLSDGKTLALALPPTAEVSRIREAALAWLVSQAQSVIGERMTYWTAKTGLTPRSWRLSNTHARWGSCSADRSIRLCWRLIFFTDDVIDYVVVHELTHIKHMDHSTRFWQAVQEVLPDYVRSREKLLGVPAGELEF